MMIFPKIVDLCLIDRCYSKRKWLMPLALLISACIFEVVSTWIMDILANLYLAVSSEDIHLFRKTLISAAFIVSLLSILKALKAYSQNICAIEWRYHIVSALHRGYFSLNRMRYWVDDYGNGNDTVSASCSHWFLKWCHKEATVTSTQKPSHFPDNMDQRMTQDADMLCSEAAELMAALIVLPLVIGYYSFHLAELFGLLVPLLCFAYFAVGLAVSSAIAWQMATRMYRQERLEGDLRFAHAHCRLNDESIWLLRGQAFQRILLQSKFILALKNRLWLIKRGFWLGLFTNWFEYAGAIGKRFVGIVCSNRFSFIH